MPEFSEKWAEERKPSLAERTREAVGPKSPLQPRLENASRQIQAQIGKLDSTLTRLSERDSSILKRAASALQKHDVQTASALSEELAEVRKMAKMVSQAKLALEQITSRLGTIQELGDIVVKLAPAVSIIKSIRPALAEAMPGAEHELSEVSSVVNDILIDAGQSGNLTVNFQVANEDAEKILAEAAAVAEQKITAKFPELATPLGLQQQAQPG